MADPTTPAPTPALPGMPPNMPFGACPLRSPIFPPPESRIIAPGSPPPAPISITGACMGTICAKFVATQADDAGRIIAGACSDKLLAVATDQIIGKLDALIKLAQKANARSVFAGAIGGDPKVV